MHKKLPNGGSEFLPLAINVKIKNVEIYGFLS